MARYSYNVDTAQKYIDIYKQFQGGLKTVDTDDALGAVFLRQADNVSLSEFGFIEKRYGTFEQFKKTVGITANSKLQGYWEFNGYIVYAVDGDIFVDGVGRIETFYTENGLRYPSDDNIPVIFTTSTSCAFEETGSFLSVTDDSTAQPSCSSGATYISCTASGPSFNCFEYTGTITTTVTVTDHFQNTRDMNAVNINNVLYIFTGTYPIYAKVVNTGTEQNPIYELKFYLFPVDVPTYEEIVAVGHNLLEDDYEGLYFDGDFGGVTTSDNTTSGSLTDFRNYFNFFVKKSNYFPKFPFSDNDGKVNFEFGYNYNTYLPEDYHFQLELRELSYAPAGSSVTDVFTPALLSDVVYNKINTNNSGTDVWLDRGLLTITNKFLDNVYCAFNSDVIEQNKTYRFAFYNGSTLVTNYATLSNIRVYDYSQDAVETYLPTFIYNNQLYFSVPDSLGFAEDYEFNLIFRNTPGYTTVYTDFKVNLFEEIPANSLFGSQILNIELSNLVPGNWDFKFVFDIMRYNASTGKVLSVKEATHYIKDVRITPEKLQDYPGSEGVAVQPTAVWTCNRVIEHFGKLMIWGSQEMKNSVFYSFPDRPAYFPQNFYLDFGNDPTKPVESVANYMNILVVQTADETWGVRGNSGLLTAPAPYVPFTINPTVGAVAWKSVRPVRNHLYFLSKQGIIALKSLYAADEQYNIEYLDLNIRNIVDRTDTDAVGIQYDNQYWLNFPKSGITLRYYIDKKAWVKDTYAWDSFKGVQQWRLENGKLFFITHPSAFEEEENLALYKIGIDEALPSDLGIPIKATFETSFLNQNYPFHPKNYKEVKLDFTLQNEYLGIKDPLTITQYSFTQEANVYSFKAALKPNHTYQISFDRSLLTEAPEDAYEDTYQVYGSLVFGLNNDSDADITNQSGDLIFTAPNDVPALSTLTLTFDDIEEDAFELYDVTYDRAIDFKMLPVSETELLIRENIQGYVIDRETIVSDLGSRFGDIDFGNTKFGDVVTAVKTNKISGRGYNIKIFFEDESKLKWTLESLGVTYKMRRARSR